MFLNKTKSKKAQSREYNQEQIMPSVVQARGDKEFSEITGTYSKLKLAL